MEKLTEVVSLVVDLALAASIVVIAYGALTYAEDVKARVAEREAIIALCVQEGNHPVGCRVQIK